MKKQTEAKTTTESKPYKPTMRELRLRAVADRLNLPEPANYVYWAMVNVLSAATAGIHQDRIVDWLRTQATSDMPTVEGPLVTWAKAMVACGILPEIVAEAVRILAAGGLVTTEARMFQTSEGEVYERTKITMLPVEEWENDRHFMAALAVRW